jgi:plastocyanin
MKKNIVDDDSSPDQILLLVLAIILCITALWAVACGGGAEGAGPTTPSSTGSTGASVTVNINSSAGNSAFSPNPVPVAAGSTVAWKNNTADLHHLVMDDGAAIGDVAPGATLTMSLKGSGGNYHCTTHPTMVGSINGTSAPPTPTGPGYDY